MRLTEYEIGEEWEECSRLALPPEKKAIVFARSIERAMLRKQANRLIELANTHDSRLPDPQGA